MLNIINYFKTHLRKTLKADQDISSYLNTSYKLDPFYASLKVTVIYGVFGTLWILLSSNLLYFFFSNQEIIRKIEMYKGWLYVLLTSIVIYFLVLKNLLLFEEALKKLWHNYDELNTAHEELIAMEEELRQQYNKLEKSNNFLQEIVYTDSLTSLPNKFAFETKIKELIGSEQSKKFALIYMDIDNFKNINDTIGHVSGDVFLKYISQILKEHVKTPHFVARLSGDEFAVIVQDMSSESDINAVIKCLLNHLRKPWKLENYEFFVTFSIGITVYPKDGNTLTSLLRNADIAMYSVKKNTKDNYSFYSYDILEQNTKRIEMVNELRHAIQNQEFTLYYQPIKHLDRECIDGVEALIRWNHPKKGLVSPMEFIPLAEETGLIIAIGKWVLETALLQKKEWEDKGYPHIKMSINVSGKSLVKDELIEDIRILLRQTNLISSEIQIEITETAFMENIEISARILEEISNMGVKIALDDFGTGYSSLTYLKKLPIDVVKLDRTFIKDILDYTPDNAIVENIIMLAHNLKLELVAEGIETPLQLDYLKSNHCDYGQGYLFSKPVSKEVMEHYWNT